MRLEKVEEGEYEDPHQVNEVPVETDLLDHFIMPSALHHTLKGHDEDDDVDAYTGEYVESVESGDEEEEIRKAGMAVFVMLEVRAVERRSGCYDPCRFSF